MACSFSLPLSRSIYYKVNIYYCNIWRYILWHEPRHHFQGQLTTNLIYGNIYYGVQLRPCHSQGQFTTKSTYSWPSPVFTFPEHALCPLCAEAWCFFAEAWCYFGTKKEKVSLYCITNCFGMLTAPPVSPNCKDVFVQIDKYICVEEKFTFTGQDYKVLWYADCTSHQPSGIPYGGLIGRSTTIYNP